MKQRSSLAVLYACLLLLLVCGLGELLFVPKDEHPSYTENRMLSAFPELTGASVFDGSFMDGFESWLSDGFFFRDGAASFSEGVKGLFTLSSDREAAEIQPSGQVFELNEEETQALDELLEEIAREDAAADGAAEETVGGPSAGVAVRLPTPTVTQDATLWVQRPDGTRLVMETFPAENIATLARVLNEYRRFLPQDGTVNLLNPPVTVIANKVMRYHEAESWGCDLDDVMQPVLDEGVTFYDLTDILTPYIGVYDLYPTIDHHWHPISVKLAQTVILGDQGVVSNDYGEYMYWLSEVHNAGPFDVDTLREVTYNLELVPILVPNAPVESYMVNRLGERSSRGVVIVREGYGGYNQYLGGNRHPWREFVTGFHTGRNALVIGDSFDLCYIVYLFPYYDRIMVTDFRDGGYDPRSVGGNVADYIEYYDVSDVYIIYCTYSSLNSSTVQDRMERYLYYTESRD